MKQTRLSTVQSILLAFFSIVLLFLVGFIVGTNLRIRREPIYTAVEATATPTVTVTETPSPTDTPSPTETPILYSAADPTPQPVYELDTFTDRFWLDGILKTENVYRTPDLSILFQCVYDTENFHRRETYYVAEIFVSDVTQIQAASFRDDFSKIGSGDVEQMAIRHDAIIAISGDYYGFHSSSLVIRNGTVYRTKLNHDDVCLLLRDGTMETISGKAASIDAILEKDPWQAWQFGPALLDEGGNARTSFPSSKLSVQNPRSCIGYVEPGHYFFVVVDGRQKNARGMTLAELASLMESLGCVQAFNLDGGASAHFFWDGKVISRPSGGGRNISDIIYIARESYPASPTFSGKDGLRE